MLATTLTMLGAFVPQGPTGSSTAPVVINEFSYDDSGTDDREFVELYNRSGAPVDISNWTLTGNDPSGPNTAFAIPAGTTLAAGDYYVIGPAGNAVPNTDLQVAGPDPANPGANLWENGQDSIELLDASGVLIDSVAYELHRGPIPGYTPEGEGFWGDFASLDGNPLSLGRLFDGYDNDDNGRDFRMYTSSPGIDNNTTAGGLPFLELFDSLSIGSAVAEMEHTFVPMLVIDPTIIDANNTTAKVPSPQGGNAAVLWDAAGGGNTARLKHEPVENISIELYAYFEGPFDNAVPTWTAQDGESWGFGVRGMSEWAGDPRDVPGDYISTRTTPGSNPPADQPGHTGIGFYYYRTTTYARVYVVDFGNGGGVNDFTIIGNPVDIVIGQNDGWQRLRLHVNGPKVHANIGGTYGLDDGVRIVGDTPTLSYGGVWFNYREFVLDNSLMRPLTVDFVTVRESQATWAQSGAACGTVGIDTNGLALIGSPSFEIIETNVPATSAFGGMVLGFFQATFPLPPSACMGMVAPDTGFINFNLMGSEYRWSLPIPNQTALVGTPVYFQCLAVPNGNLGAMQLTALQQANLDN